MRSDNGFLCIYYKENVFYSRYLNYLQPMIRHNLQNETLIEQQERKKERLAKNRERQRKKTKKIFKQKPNKYGATREMRLTFTCGALQLTNESAMDCLP